VSVNSEVSEIIDWAFGAAKQITGRPNVHYVHLGKTGKKHPSFIAKTPRRKYGVWGTQLLDACG
jgi:hypothetical protein